MSNIQENIDSISQIFKSDKKRTIFKKYIEYIRFPFFKNFDQDLKVNFDYPITFLVGQNGSGKSSLLQALYGAPLGNSIASYWYTTALDPIEDLKKNRHCFIYSFLTENSKRQVEVLKERIQNKDKKTKKINPDYWEPARPKISYGMDKFPNNADARDSSKTRWNLLKNEVLYMDFRYSLSAYDKYFYFGSKPSQGEFNSKQDVIRKYAPRIKSTFDHNRVSSYYSRSANAPIKLSAYELEVIKKILGKKYIEAKIIEHDFYDRERGFAIRYKTNNAVYSEAYAGSGEIAVVNLIHDIYTANDNSLVLLDEPETSLHPTAQKRLMNFVLEQCKRKKLQVVISTHSPDIIEGMPKEAIKILYENADTGKVNIIEDVYPEKAFLHIGRSYSNRKIIVVEDDFAKLIVDKVLEENDDQGLFEVRYFPGGESLIKREHMLVYSKEEDCKHFILFDGDQCRSKIDVTGLSDSDKNIENLEMLIKEIIGENIKINHDSGRPEQKIDLMLKYIEYHHDCVYFLPKNIPEEIIWDDDILERADLNDNEKIKIKGLVKYKDKFNLFAKYNFGDNTAQYQRSAFEYFLTRWVEKKNSDYQSINSTIDKLKQI